MFLFQRYPSLYAALIDPIYECTQFYKKCYENPSFPFHDILLDIRGARHLFNSTHAQNLKRNWKTWSHCKEASNMRRRSLICEWGGKEKQERQQYHKMLDIGHSSVKGEETNILKMSESWHQFEEKHEHDRDGHFEENKKRKRGNY